MFIISNIFFVYESYNNNSNKQNLRKHNYTETIVTNMLVNNTSKQNPRSLNNNTCRKYLRSSINNNNIIYNSHVSAVIPEFTKTVKLHQHRLRKKIVGKYCINPNITISISELVHLLF